MTHTPGNRREQMERMRAYSRRNKRLRFAGYVTYKEYLASPEWAALRQKVLDRDGGRCVACRDDASCVHHAKYSNRVLFGTEPSAALISLCNRCHKFIEFNEDGSKTSTYHAMQKLRWLCRSRGTSLPGRCSVCMKGGARKQTGMCGRCGKQKQLE